MSVNYPQQTQVVGYTWPITIAPGPEQQAYKTAKSEFNHGYNDFFADQYGRNANKGLEALTTAIEQEMRQVKTQLAQNQLQLAQIQARLNVTA